MVAACQAGKDVYCEKPIGRTIEECNLMISAAKKHKTVVQVGQWQRSDPHWQDAVNLSVRQTWEDKTGSCIFIPGLVSYNSCAC